jgi:MFS transporter, DHA1 family, multidrug resistance protein
MEPRAGQYGGGSRAVRNLREGAGPVYVVMAGRLMTNTGFFMVIPFLTVFLADHEGMSGFQVGVFFAILQFTRRVLGVFAGWLSDRYGAAPILSAGLGLESAAYVWFAFAGRSFVAWAAAVALLGFGGAMNNNGSRTLITAGRSATSAVNLSRYYVSINLAGLIGPLIGSVLLTAGLARIGFLIAAGLHVLFGVASMILLHGMPIPEARQVRLSTMADGLRDKALLRYCGLAVGGWFLISQYRIALPLTIVHQKLSGGWLGPLTALNAIICMIAVFLIGKWIGKRGTVARLDVLSISGVVLGGGWLLCSFGGLGPLAAAVVVTSLGESLFCSVLDAVVVTMAPPGGTGLYLGYSALAWGIGGMLAGFTGGLFDVAARDGALVGFWAGLAAVGLAAAIGTRLACRYFSAVVAKRQAAAPATSAVSS